MPPDEKSGADRRIHPRFALMAQVRVKRGKVDYVMDLTNISCGGAQVDMGSLKTPSWIQRGRSVEMGIINPVDFDIVEVVAEVVRIDRGEIDTKFAVRFVGLDALTRERVERLVTVANPVPVGPPPLPARPPANPHPQSTKKLPPPLPEG